MGVIRIGLLDSGTGAELAERVLARSRFELDPDGSVKECDALADASGHGSSIGRIIATLAPQARIFDAQVFGAGGVSSPAAVAGGLEWLTRHGVHIVNMSFGLLENREVLRVACERARQAGAVLLAATPVRGQPVFPAAYPGVIRICADGRCGHREVSSLWGEPAHFGACPLPLGQRTYVRMAGGASHAVAHATGIVAAWMSEKRGADHEEVHSYLASIARHTTRPTNTRQAARRNRVER
jgi:hypothetical protein